MTRSRTAKITARNLAARSPEVSYSKARHLTNTSKSTNGRFAKAFAAEVLHRNFIASLQELARSVGESIAVDEDDPEFFVTRRLEDAFCANNCRCEGEVRDERQLFWDKVFSFLPSGMVPQLLKENVILSEDGNHDTEAIIFVSFFFPEGHTFDEYAAVKEQLKDSLGVQTLALVPVAGLDDLNTPIVGSVGRDGFQLMFLENEKPDIFGQQKTRLSLTSHDIIDHSIWKLGNCVLTECKMITRSSSPQRILELTVAADKGFTQESMELMADSIRAKTGVPWVAVAEQMNHSGIDTDHRDAIRIYLSDTPDTSFWPETTLFFIGQRLEVKEATSGLSKYGEPIAHAFSSDGIIPVGFSDVIFEPMEPGSKSGSWRRKELVPNVP